MCAVCASFVMKQSRTRRGGRLFSKLTDQQRMSRWVAMNSCQIGKRARVDVFLGTELPGRRRFLVLESEIYDAMFEVTDCDRKASGNLQGRNEAADLRRARRAIAPGSRSSRGSRSHAADEILAHGWIDGV